MSNRIDARNWFWLIVLSSGLLYATVCGMVKLVGAEYIMTIATVATYITVPIVVLWALAAVVGGPIAVICRFISASRMRRAERRAVEADSMCKVAESMAKVKRERFITSTGKQVLSIDTENGEHKHYLAPTPKQLLLQQDPEAVDDGPKHTAIDIIKLIADRMRGTKNAPRFIFAGPTRSGKTFMAQRVTEIIDAEYYALDPKEEDPEEPWPAGVRVVGQGDDWQQMRMFFKWVFAEKEKRAKLMQSNPSAFKRLPKIVIFVEELLTTLKGDDDFAEYYIRILTKFAQFGIGVIPITHAITATAMGFPKGFAQLIDCFDAVFRFDYDIMTDTRESYVIMRGKVEQPLLKYVHTGRGCRVSRQHGEPDDSGYNHRVDRATTSTTSTTVYLPPPAEIKHINIEHKQVYEAFKSGMKIYSICKDVLGRGNGNLNYKPNSRDYAYVKSILALYEKTEG